jgi:glycosyltransferase involved in cell wall biosynthesis
VKHLLIYSDCAGQYGAEQVNHSLALGLRAAGFHVSFAQPQAAHKLIREREALGIDHCWLPAERLYDLDMPAPSLSDRGPAATIFNQCAPDLVLFADGCPFSSLAAKQCCAMLGIPFVVLVHCVYARWLEDYRAFAPALERAYQTALQVIAVSADNLQLLRQYFGLAQGKGCVIYNGRPDAFFAEVDAAQRVHLRDTLGVGVNDILCLSIGRMEAVKGYEFQLEAMARLVRRPCWELLHFVWIGSGTQQQRFLRVARLLAKGKFTHYEAYAEIPLLLGAADMLLHTARYEGMPLVVLEAMAAALPVVATAVSGVPEAIGETGVLLNSPQHAADLSQEIIDAVCSLALDAPQRARLGQAARRRARDLFGEDRMVQQYRHVLAEAMTGIM